MNMKGNADDEQYAGVLAKAVDGAGGFGNGTFPNLEWPRVNLMG